MRGIGAIALEVGEGVGGGEVEEVVGWREGGAEGAEVVERGVVGGGEEVVEGFVEEVGWCGGWDVGGVGCGAGC